MTFIEWLRRPGFVAKAVKMISFISFTVVSYILSLSMYLALGQETWEKVVFTIINTALEAFKVYNVILASTYLYYARAGHKLYSAKELRAKAVGRYFIYGIVAATSIFAAAGFSVSVVDRMSFLNENTSTTLQLTSISDKITLQKDRIKLQQDIIVTQQGIIKNAETLSENVITRKQNIIADAQKQISAATKVISDAQTAILTLEDEKLKSSSVRIEERKEVKRTMFVIMGEILKIPPTVLIIIMLIIASVLIEVGAVMTAPHSLYIEETEQITSPPKIEEGKEERPYTKRKKEYWDAPKKSRKREPESVEESESTEPLILPEPTPQLVQLFTEEPQPPSRPIPVREVHAKSKEQLFTEALINNGSHPYLRDRYEAGSDLHMSAGDVDKVFSHLYNTPGPNKDNFIKFKVETGKWYANYPLEVILNHLEGKSLL